MPARTPEAILDPYRPLLGVVPDQQIARQAGVSRALVLAWRQRLGVGAYQGYKFGAPGRPLPPRTNDGATAMFRGRRSALDPFAKMLGQVPDAEVARLAGVTAENVRTYRARRGIAPHWQGTRTGEAEAARRTEPKPAPRAVSPRASRADPPPPPQPREVYAVTVADGGTTRVYGLLATDTADAIRRAGSAVDLVCPTGRIRGVQRVGELLEDAPAVQLRYANQ